MNRRLVWTHDRRSSLVRCLQQLKSTGVTVVAVVHQPAFRVFRQFSHLLLLAPGGKTAFHGSTSQGLEYFVRNGFR